MIRHGFTHVVDSKVLAASGTGGSNTNNHQWAVLRIDSVGLED